MSEMIDRVARAIEEASQPPGRADYTLLMRNCAIAAIGAMRDATEDMIEKGVWSRSESGCYQPRDIAITIYQAMIDAALADSNGDRQ